MLREAEGALMGAKGLWWFVGLAFAWSWLLNLPRVLATAGVLELPDPASFGLGTLAVFGPGLAAFVLTYQELGTGGVTRLWRRGWDWRVSGRWLAVLVLLPFASSAVIVLLLALIGRPIEWRHGVPLATRGAASAS